MITDIPTPHDFRTQGTVFLHLAWDAALALYSQLEEAEIAEWDSDGTVTEEYWQAAQRSLATATTLLGQGSEFLLKAEIIETSPFLLLAGGPREWPGGTQDQDVSFARFRTIDAQDLIRVHDTVRPNRLDHAFRQFINDLRERRNKVMHTVDPSLRFTGRDIIVGVLEISHHLLGPQRWIQLRWDYHAETPTSVAYSTDHVDFSVNTDVMVSLRSLTPAEVDKYYGFDKKQRRYICSACAFAIDNAFDNLGRARTALLHPKSRAIEVRCFVCSKSEPIRRDDCPSKGCSSNVIGLASGACLLCFERVIDPEVAGN